MARELVWRENNTFTAWGCGACNWVLAKPGKKTSAKPSTQVRKCLIGTTAPNSPAYNRRSVEGRAAIHDRHMLSRSERSLALKFAASAARILSM